MSLRFHLDENVARAVAEGLQRRMIDVTTMSNTELGGASDEAHLAFAVRERRVIFTHDADFLRLAVTGVEHAGIVYSHVQTRLIGQIVNGLAALSRLRTADELRNRIEFL